jgi:hypothetical protein
MSHPNLSAQEALFDAAAEVASNLRAHESYRGSYRRAIAALRRRRPGFTDGLYHNALDAGIAVFDTARRLVDEQYATLRAAETRQGPGTEELADMLQSRCPGFPSSTYVWLVNWIDLYYHRM